MNDQPVQPDIFSRLRIRTLTPRDICTLMNFDSMRTCYDFINKEAQKGSFLVKRIGRQIRVDEETFVEWYRSGS